MNLSGVCPICGDDRPDGKISTRSRSRLIGGLPMREILRYCNDRETCRTTSFGWMTHPDPDSYHDGLPLRRIGRPERKGKRSAAWLLVPGFLAVAVVALVVAVRGEAHLVKTPDSPTKTVRENLHAQQTENLYHARYVCRNGGGAHKVWACKAATGWLLREWRETKPEESAWWVRKQIRVAELIGQGGDRGGTDPWPNCPDPYDHRGASWTDTLACENRGWYEIYGNTPKAWLDSPGYFRCGLQFEPRWEDVYGKLCP